MAKESSYVLEITAANFKREVLERSKKTPVVLDFWASWCGPCKTLGPVLERLAEEGKGAFYLGKVNTEAEQALAYQFGVQSIPFVVAMANGKPVDAFVGALPEAEVRTFLSSVGIALDAHGAEPQGQPEVAKDPATPEGAFAAGVAAIRAGALADAKQALDRIPEEHDLYTSAERLRQALEFFALDDAGAAAAPAGAALVRAAVAFRARRYGESLRECLESVRADAVFRDSLARRGMVGIFVVLGEQDPLTEEYRRLLTQALY